MYILRYTSQFHKGAKQCKKDGMNMQELKDALELLKQTGTLPESYRPHELHEEYAGYIEAHIEDDWLIIWRKKDSELELLMTATGTHKSLFGEKDL